MFFQSGLVANLGFFSGMDYKIREKFGEVNVADSILNQENTTNRTKKGEIS